MYKWKGTELSSKGIIVEKKPTISKGKKKIETYDVPGRSGFLSIDTGTYEPFEVSLECHLDTSVSNLDEVKEFLDGYGTLQFEADRQYTAIINNAIPFEVVAKKFRSFIIQFLVNPIAESTTNYQIAPVGTQTVTIDAATTMYPLIFAAFINTADLTINGTTFTLEKTGDNMFFLDCKNQEVYDSNHNNMAEYMSGDFPTLKPGTNTISYTTPSAAYTINYRKTYF